MFVKPKFQSLSLWPMLLQTIHKKSSQFTLAKPRLKKNESLLNAIASICQSEPESAKQASITAAKD